MNVLSEDGTAIAYNKSGQGEPVILVDGAFCSKDFGPMPKIALLLSEHFTVFTYDRRGRGESGDADTYEIQREIQDLEALIQLAGGNVFLFGISSGAVLAMKASAVLSNVRKLALYEPPFNIGMKFRKPPFDYRSKLKHMISAGKKADAVRYYLEKVIGLPALVRFIIRLTPNWKKMQHNANSLPYDAEVMADGSLTAELTSGIIIPTLIIAGEKSPEMLRVAAKEVSEKIVNAQFKMLKGQTHNVSAQVIGPVVTDFLKK